MHWHSLIARHAKSLRIAVSKGLKALDAQLAQASQRAALEPVLVRSTPKQPLHPLARIRQSQSRWFSTARRSIDSSVRHFTTATGKAGVKYDRASFPKSTIGSYVRSSSGRAPFASTLRPNLTGGTLGRTAGGYTTGSGRVGGQRFFSHGPASQAQVIQNVNSAVRAFFISGQKAQYDGVTPNGEKRFKAVSALQEETGRKMRSLPKATPGSWVEFQVNPTITALTSLDSVAGFSMSAAAAPNDHLNSSGLLDVLSIDFSRALKDLAAVLNDLKKLSALGDVPITYEGSHLRVHFPGCDAATVECLCEELSVQRGTVVQDEHFDNFVGTEIALLFPFAPTKEGSLTEDSDGADFFEPVKPVMAPQRHVISLDDMLSDMHTPAYSTQSDTGFEDVLAEENNPWLSSSSGYQSVHSGSLSGSDKHSPLEYQGFEGIYRFIEELDAVR